MRSLCFATLALVIGCGDSGTDPGPGGGGNAGVSSSNATATSASSASTTSTTASTTNASTTTGGPMFDECATEGLEPPSGPYACGSVGCAADEVCVESLVTTFASTCFVHFCAAVPPACAATPDCACLEAHVMYEHNAIPTCSEPSGKLRLDGLSVPNPPWTTPACPGETCLAGEKCWGCMSDGFHGFWEAPTFVCDDTNPSVPAVQSCIERTPL